MTRKRQGVATPCGMPILAMDDLRSPVDCSICGAAFHAAIHGRETGRADAPVRWVFVVTSARGDTRPPGGGHRDDGGTPIAMPPASMLAWGCLRQCLTARSLTV